MKATTFPSDLLAALQKSKSIRVQAGTEGHRFIGIWIVIVKDRMMARSWSVKPEGWYHTFLREPRGAIQVGKKEIAISAKPVKKKDLRDAADRAYRKKYNSEWEMKYVKDLCGEKSRATTIELVLWPQTGRRRDE